MKPIDGKRAAVGRREEAAQDVDPGFGPQKGDHGGNPGVESAEIRSSQGSDPGDGPAVGPRDDHKRPLSGFRGRLRNLRRKPGGPAQEASNTLLIA
ncbi:hypothetical protein KM043_006583 [Ampulex compressa]|nr:hypothetical protein KM043_006583 [Ampulex compressa]